MFGTLLGNRSWLPFRVLLSLRSQLIHHRLSTLLTFLAFALSVGLAATVELATRSTATALERTAEAMLGAADLEIVAGDVGVAEHWIEELRDDPVVTSASPVIEHTFRVADGPRAGEALRVIALDLLYDSEVRDYDVEQGGYRVRDAMRLVASPNAIILSESLATRLGAAEGDVLALRSPDGDFEMVVRGFLGGTLADAFGGQLAVMDVYGLQHLLGMEARVGRIDVALADGSDAGAVLAALQARLGPEATVRRPSMRETYLNSVMGTLTTAAWTVALIGVVLAAFLSYAVTSLTVDRRLEEFSLLRAAGMTGRGVTRVIVTDVVILAVAGTAVGLAAAVFLADPMVAATSSAIEYIEHATIEQAEVRWTTLVVALMVGLPVPLIASWLPAVRAGRKPALEMLHGTLRTASRSRASRSMLLLGLLCAVGVAACILPVLPPPVRLILAIPLGASAVALGATQLLLFGFRAVQGILAASIPRIGPLASAYLLERPIETGATLAVWAAVCGGVVALLSGVYSMATTIDDYWVGLTGDEVVAIFAQDPLRSRDREPIRADTIAAIRTTPGVAEVAEFYLTTVMIDGEEVYLETLAVEPLVLHSGGSPTISRDPERTLEALRRGDLAVSEAFVRHFGLDIGDTVELATTRGSRTFRIGAYAHAYAAGPTGSMFLDVPVFSEWFPTDSAPEVDVWIGGVRQEVLDAIQARSAQPLFFRHGDDYANHTKKVIAKFTGLLLVPVSLIGLVGAISLLNLLFANVIGRRRELALVRAAGGTAANVSALVLANGIVIALLATLSGLVLGLAWTPVVADALGDAMGYGIVARLSPAAVWAVVIAAIPLALLSGLGPALLGSRTGVDQLVARS